MTGEMVERVARAMREAECQWGSQSSEEQHLAMARAAIEAMREPTGAMVNAAWASWEDVEGSKGFVGVWQAMIDAAMQEK